MTYIFRHISLPFVPLGLRSIVRRLTAALLTLPLLLLGAGGALAAPEDTAARIKAAVEKNTAGKVVVTAINPTPVAGLFEVTSGLDVFYVDATGRYGLVDGRLVDMKEQRDLTAARLDQLTRVDFRRLPLDLAIKEVHGNGRRVLAIFEDPGCPVCRVLHKFLDQLPDVTIYRFMYPVTDPQSVPKAQAAWCSNDRRAAWSALMTGTGGPTKPVPGCDAAGLVRILNTGDQLQIQGTPTVFLANGKRLVGATPPEQFIAALDESAAATR